MNANATKKIYVTGTFDTKGKELGYLIELLRQAGHETFSVDLSTSTTGNTNDAQCTSMDVASFHPEGRDAVSKLTDRGEAIEAMSFAFEKFIASRDDIAGIIGAGGSGGTALLAPGFRSLPIGLPKVLVSTMASGNVAPYIGASDITLVYSVTDVEGLNRISREVLGNAAHALAGMVSHAPKITTTTERAAIGLSMFGVTTPCVKSVVSELDADNDCLVFHATGAGGRSMEKLVDSGMISAVLDLTTTEIADMLVGGVLAATDDRLGAIIRTEVPYVGSVGALDMVNFGARDAVPEKFSDRLFHVHNPQVTLMRTTIEENRQIGLWIAERLNLMNGPVSFLLPEKGVSMLDVEGQPFFDPAADSALFEALESNVNQTKQRRLLRVPAAINDPEFASVVVEQYRLLTG